MSAKRPPSDIASEKYDGNVVSVENAEESVAKVVDDDDGELLLPETRQRAEKRLVRKLDFRLLPTIVLIFILNYIDVSEHVCLATCC